MDFDFLKLLWNKYNGETWYPYAKDNIYHFKLKQLAAKGYIILYPPEYGRGKADFAPSAYKLFAN